MKSVIVIGGGAAGMAAAIAAAECGDRVTLLERMDRVGKKILATGNGRCNLMNTGEGRYPGGPALAKAVLQRCGAQEQTRFWHHLGLRLRQEDGGRVYPVSGMASTVLDTLRFSMQALGVEVLTGVHVDALRLSRQGWTAIAGEEKFRADRVIVAGGGCAQPKLGSDGSAYHLLTDAGHLMHTPRPALTQVLTDVTPIRGLSGIRVRCSVRVEHEGRTAHEEQGEVLFADYGVTGVCIMQCARFAPEGSIIHIDLTRALGFGDRAELHEELQRRRSDWAARSAAELLTGLCVPKLGLALMRNAGIRADGMTCGQMTNRMLQMLTDAAADLSLTVKGVKGFEQAQVTAGGVNTGEFDPDTMASFLLPGLHAAGEVLDVDGDCGGFNLMFAFGSGILAGLNGRYAPW